MTVDMSSRLEVLPPPPLLGAAPFPAADEHFGSYLRRLAIANGRHSLWAIVSDMGLNSLSPLSSDAYWQRMIDATGLEPERLAPLRIPHTDRVPGDIGVVAGIEIQRGFLDRFHLRSCPACVEEDGLLPTSFAIRQVTACVRHGVATLDECPCGSPLKAYAPGALWNCPACGTEIADMPRVAAEEGEIAVAKAMLAPHGLTNAELPVAFLEETSTARAAVIERLGTIALFERDDAPSRSRYNGDRRRPDKADNGRRLAADRTIVLGAAKLLAEWPDVYHATFARLVDRHGASRACALLVQSRAVGPVACAARGCSTQSRSMIVANAESAKRLITAALGFREAARGLLQIDGMFHWPAFNTNVGLAAEMALKAFLVSRGRTDTYCRNKIGHDLQKGLYAARMAGLRTTDDNADLFIELLNPPYRSHEIRYLSGEGHVDFVEPEQSKRGEQAALPYRP